MRHRVDFRKLNRTSEHRWAMLRTMVTQLIEHGRIRTTVPKAKELRRVADKMVTKAKNGSLHARRHAARVVRTRGALNKLFEELGPRYEQRDGGYTRVLRCGNRYGDWAPMAYIEFVDREGELRPAKQPWNEEASVLDGGLSAEGIFVDREDAGAEAGDGSAGAEEGERK